MSNNSVVSGPKKNNAEILLSDKKFLVVLNPTDINPLSFAENLIYSATIRQPASGREIASLTGLGRREVVPNALKKLLELNLVQCENNQYSGLEPPIGWYTVHDETKTWQERFRYYHFRLLKKEAPLTARQNALFCRIINYPGQLPARYASHLDIPIRTVFHELKKLRQLGLIKPTKGYCWPTKSLPDYWIPQIQAKQLLADYYLNFIKNNNNAFCILNTEKALAIIEQQSQRLIDKGWFNITYLNKFWSDTFSQLNFIKRLELLFKNFSKIVDHILSKGKTKAYFKSTLEIVIKIILDREWNGNPVSYFSWTFDPLELFN